MTDWIWEYRAATVAAVSFPRREIELVVMPYEVETVVDYRGRPVREVIARGAFDGIEARPRRVSVNRDHDGTRLVGKAVAFHPERPDGLIAEVRISRTDLGEETLQLAHDGMLDASAGFAPYPDGERWNGSLRRVTKAWLDHVALVADPAYPDAKVLAVRTSPETPRSLAEARDTPNLDRVRSWALSDAYEALERR